MTDLAGGSSDAAASGGGVSRRALARAYSLGPWLCVPLRGRDQILGVLTVAHQDGRHFTKTAVGVLEAFADQASMAVENRRLFGEARRQADQLATIMQVNKRLALGPELDEVLARITDAARLLGAQAAGCGWSRATSWCGLPASGWPT